MAQTHPIAVYQSKGSTISELNQARHQMIQSLAVQMKSGQEIVARKIDESKLGVSSNELRIGLHAEDPKMRLFSKEQHNEEKFAANKIIAEASPEWANFKRDQLAAQGAYERTPKIKEREKAILRAKEAHAAEKDGLEANYQAALEKASSGDPEAQLELASAQKLRDDSARSVGRAESALKREVELEVWKAATLTGADLQQALKVSLLVNEGILERNMAINADIADNLDALVQNLPALKSLNEQDKLTPQQLAADVPGSFHKLLPESYLLAKTDAIAVYRDGGGTQTEIQKANNELIQNLAARTKPGQEIVARKIDQSKLGIKSNELRIGLHAEDPKMRLFGKEQHDKEKFAANKIIANASPEWANFKRDQLAAQGAYERTPKIKEREKAILSAKEAHAAEKDSLEANYQAALEKASSGDPEAQLELASAQKLRDDSARSVGRAESALKREVELEVWKAATLTGADMQQASKVSLLVNEGILEQNTAINADIADNLDALVQNLPALKSLNEQGQLTPPQLAADVTGSLRAAAAVNLTEPEQALAPAENIPRQTTGEKLRSKSSPAKKAGELGVHADQEKERVKDTLKTDRKDKVKTDTPNTKVAKLGNFS